MATISFEIGRDITLSEINLGRSIYACYLKTHNGITESYFKDTALVEPSEDQPIDFSFAINTTNNEISTLGDSKIQTYSIPGYNTLYNDTIKEIKGWGYVGSALDTERYFIHENQVSPFGSNETKQWNFILKPVLLYDNLHGGNTSMPTLSYTNNTLRAFVNGVPMGECDYDPSTDKIVLYWGEITNSISFSNTDVVANYTHDDTGSFPTIPFVGAICQFSDGSQTGPMLYLAAWGAMIHYDGANINWQWSPSYEINTTYKIKYAEISYDTDLNIKPTPIESPLYKLIILNNKRERKGSITGTKTIGKYAGSGASWGFYGYYPQLGNTTVMPAWYTTVHGILQNTASFLWNINYEYIEDIPAFSFTNNIDWRETRGRNGFAHGGNNPAWIINPNIETALVTPLSWNFSINAGDTFSTIKITNAKKDWKTVTGPSVTLPHYWKGVLNDVLLIPGSSTVENTITIKNKLPSHPGLYPCAIVIWTNRGN